MTSDERFFPLSTKHPRTERDCLIVVWSMLIMIFMFVCYTWRCFDCGRLTCTYDVMCVCVKEDLFINVLIIFKFTIQFLKKKIIYLFEVIYSIFVFKHSDSSTKNEWVMFISIYKSTFFKHCVLRLCRRLLENPIFNLFNSRRLLKDLHLLVDVYSMISRVFFARICTIQQDEYSLSQDQANLFVHKITLEDFLWLSHNNDRIEVAIDSRVETRIFFNIS